MDLSYRHIYIIHAYSYILDLPAAFSAIDHECQYHLSTTFRDQHVLGQTAAAASRILFRHSWQLHCFWNHQCMPSFWDVLGYCGCHQKNPQANRQHKQ